MNKRQTLKKEIIEGKRQVFSSYEIIQFSVEFSGSVGYQKTNIDPSSISTHSVHIYVHLYVYTHTILVTPTIRIEK